MKKKYTIGIDFGTLSSRAVLVDIATGEEISIYEHKYKNGVIDKKLNDIIELKVDWALQNPNDYLESLEICVSRVIKDSQIDVANVIAIGVDFTSCTMLPVLEDGTPLMNLEEFKNNEHAYVKLWKHHASQKEADHMNRIALERKEDFLNWIGGKISSEWMFPKILQILEEAPEVYAATYSFMEASDWIVMQLTGRMTRNECSLGCKSLWNKEFGFPTEEYFHAVNPKLKNVVAEKMKGEIVQVGSKAGAINKRASRLTLLKEGTIVAAGHLDAGGATPGVGIINSNHMLIMMGTSNCHIILSEKKKFLKGISGIVDGGMVPGLYGYEAGQSSVGDHFDWVIKNAVNKTYLDEALNRNVNMHELLSEKAMMKNVGENGLVALDWWNGNRSVLDDGYLSGVLMGMTLKTQPEDIYRALIEGTAFGTRKIIETFESQGINIEQITISGGIALKNPFIVQIYSDVTGKIVNVARTKQNAALSSAIWAALAAGKENGGYDSLSDATKSMMSEPKLAYQPNFKNKKSYDFLYKYYLTLHDYFGVTCRDMMKNLKVFQNKVLEENNVN